MVSSRPGSSSTNSKRELMLKLRRCGGDANDELGALHRLAFHFDGASMRLYDFLHQVQSEPRTVHLVRQRFPPSKERIKNMLALFGWDAGTTIHYTNLDGAAL